MASPIYRLPSELAQLLAKSFLEPFEATLLAFCSKKFLELLGAQYWKICQENVDQKNELLSVWERDFPEMIHCIRCARLHNAKSKPQLDLNWQCQHFENNIRHIGISCPRDNLRCIYIQAALKRHRLGLGVEQYLKALNYEYYSASEYFLAGSSSYSFSEARIVSGELLVRVQDWSFHPLEVLTEGFPNPAVCSLYLGCPHYENGCMSREVKNMLIPFIDNPLNWEILGQPNNHLQGLRQCRFCESELQLDVVPFVDLALERSTSTRRFDRYIAMVRTIWANYGDGSPSPNGKYYSHFVGEPRKSSNWQIAVHNPAVFEPGSIKNAFENGKKFSFETLISKEKMKALKASVIDNDRKLAITKDHQDRSQRM